MIGKHGHGNIGADPKDEYGRTPLSLVAEEGHEAVVRLLVERDDVEADSNDKWGQTSLSRAAGGGHEAVVRLLVGRGARLDIRDTIWHGTPLGWAVHGGNARTEMADCLRSLGAVE